MESKSVEEVAEATGLSEEQVKRKYPFSFGQVKPAKGTFKEGMSQAVDLGTDIAPIVGTAKAVAELPEDAELIKELIAAGYEESDIKKMGMGGAYTALTVAGLLPGVKVAADIAKKGIKEGVEGAVKETATQTARALNVTTEKSPLRTLYDDLPETERAMLPPQPDEYGLYGYHGTASARGADEPFFDINFARTNDQFLGEGFYFTLDPEIASEYASIRGIGTVSNTPETRVTPKDLRVLVADTNVKPEYRRNVDSKKRDAFGNPVPTGTLYKTPEGQYYSMSGLQKGEDIYGQPIAKGQSISRFDLSNLKKPYVVRTEKQRKELKAKIPELKEQGYDSVLFADFKDRSKQIMVFPEHMHKIDTSSIAGRSASSSSRQIGNPEYDAIFSKLDELETPEEWQSAAKNLVSGERDITGMSPVRRTPELEQSARDLIDNKLLTREEHLKNVAENKPITEWTDLPRQPSSKAMVFSLKPSQRENGLFLLSGDDANKLGVKQTTLKDGDMFNGRLDIPAYQSYDTWVVAGTSPAVKTADGKSVTTYAKAIHYTSGDDKPVKFVASQKTSEGIGKGEKQKTGYATISGRYKDTSEEELRALAEKYLNDPEWSQVGFDPRRLGTFYLRRSTGDYKIGTPVTEADEVIQIGPLVLAKNAKLDPDYQGYNKGGAVPMKEQMEMFEDGGLKDEGGTIDPVSGNDVPPGSTQEEVRDDIPAQLSEGEFVFPADVVRYIGLGNLMRMRQEAKMGLRLMEEMGQMGNSDEATIPDDIPFDINDLDIDEEEEYNMAVGGMVPAQQQTPATTGVIYRAPQFQPGQTQVGQAAAPIPMAQVARPQQQQVPVYQPPETLPSPAEFVKAPEGQAPQTIVIVNKETGEERTITFIPGVTQIPQGFVRKEDYVPKEVVPETPTTTVESATVRDTGDSDDERRRKEEEIYGSTGGRVGVGQDIYGVSFDMPEGFIPGAMGMAGTAFGLATGKPLPENTTVNFKRGEIEFSVTGKQYNEFKQQAEESGYNSKEAKNKFDRMMAESSAKAAEEARKKKEAADAAIKAAKDAAAKKAAEEEKQRQQAIEQQKLKQLSEANINTLYGRSEDRTSQQEQQAQNQRTADEFTREAVRDVTDRISSGRGFAEGGLAGKPKPKAKKMKRGGLASKK